MTLNEARQLALELMEEHGVLQDGWVFQWSNGKRQLGSAQIRKMLDRCTGKRIERKAIKLSRYLVALNSDEEVRDTILHEIAHAIAGLENGHNHVWRAVCRRIGAKPQRLAGEEVVTVPGRYVIVCTRCDRQLGRRHRRMPSTTLARSYCKHCGLNSKGSLELRHAPPILPGSD